MTTRATSLPREVPIEVRYSAGQALVFADAGARAAPDRIATEAKDSEVEIVAYSGGKMDFGFYAMYPDLEGMEASEDGIMPILRQHDGGKIAGQSKSIEASPERGLVLKADLYDQAGDKGTEHGREITTLRAKGFRWQASIGFRCDPAKFQYLDDADQKATVNGKEIAGPAIIARRWRLKEASLVPLGADANTSMATITASATVTRPPLDNRRKEGQGRKTTMDPIVKAADDEKDEKDKDDAKDEKKASLADLKAAFPKHREFALDCAEAGLSLVAAKAKWSDEVQAGRLSVAGATPAPAPAKAPSPRQPIPTGPVLAQAGAAAAIDPDARVAVPKNAGPAAREYLSLVASAKVEIFADKLARGMPRPLASYEAEAEAKSRVSREYRDVHAAYVREGSGVATWEHFPMRTPSGDKRQ